MNRLNQITDRLVGNGLQAQSHEKRENSVSLARYVMTRRAESGHNGFHSVARENARRHREQAYFCSGGISLRVDGIYVSLYINVVDGLCRIRRRSCNSSLNERATVYGDGEYSHGLQPKKAATDRSFMSV